MTADWQPIQLAISTSGLVTAEQYAALAAELAALTAQLAGGAIVGDETAPGSGIFTVKVIQ